MKRNNSQITFTDFIAISEGKGVGTLYHFTRVQSLLNMIGGDFNMKSHQDYISFTRNYNLMDYDNFKNDLSLDYKMGDKRGIRISIDGDKLSNKYKIKPFLDVTNDVKRESGENEEIIESPSVKISDVIVQVDVFGVTNDVYLKVKEALNYYDDKILVVFSKTLKKLKKVKI